MSMIEGFPTEGPPATVLDPRRWGPLTLAGIALVVIGLVAWLTSMAYSARRATLQRQLLLEQLSANHALGERLERRIISLQHKLTIVPEPIPRPESRP